MKEATEAGAARDGHADATEHNTDEGDDGDPEHHSEPHQESLTHVFSNVYHVSAGSGLKRFCSRSGACNGFVLLSAILTRTHSVSPALVGASRSLVVETFLFGSIGVVEGHNVEEDAEGQAEEAGAEEGAESCLLGVLVSLEGVRFVHHS